MSKFSMAAPIVLLLAATILSAQEKDPKRFDGGHALLNKDGPSFKSYVTLLDLVEIKYAGYPNRLPYRTKPALGSSVTLLDLVDKPAYDLVRMEHGIKRPHEVKD